MLDKTSHTKPILQMLVGLSGSGKSTYAESTGRTVYSSDALRAELYGDINDQTHNTEVFAELHKRIINALARGENCVYDATNLSAKRRKAFLKSIANIDCVKICTIIAAPFLWCVENDTKRDRHVGYNVIHRQMRQFEMPHLAEGWDTIHVVRQQEDRYIDLSERFKYKELDMEHDTPYHRETIQQHMRMAANLAMEAGEDKEFYEAVLFHDYGKFYTKVFHDAKGRPTEFAHFYGHENVSAYMYLTSKNFKGLDYLYLIQFHMMTLKGEKAWVKFKKQYGDELADAVARFSEYDTKGRCGYEN